MSGPIGATCPLCKTNGKLRRFGFQMKRRPEFDEAGQMLTIPGVVLQLRDIECRRGVGFQNSPAVLMDTVDGDALRIFEAAAQRKHRAEPGFSGPGVRVVAVSDFVDEQVYLALVLLRALVPGLLLFSADHQRVLVAPGGHILSSRRSEVHLILQIQATAGRAPLTQGPGHVLKRNLAGAELADLRLQLALPDAIEVIA